VFCACADTLAFFGFCEIREGSGKFARQKRGFWEIQNNSQNPEPKKSRTQKMAPTEITRPTKQQNLQKCTQDLGFGALVPRL
jgi:hypothetical protein